MQIMIFNRVLPPKCIRPPSPNNILGEIWVHFNISPKSWQGVWQGGRGRGVHPSGWLNTFVHGVWGWVGVSGYDLEVTLEYIPGTYPCDGAEL